MLYGVTAFELKGKSALVEKDKNIRGKNQHSRGETLHYTDFALSLSLLFLSFLILSMWSMCVLFCFPLTLLFKCI